MNNNYEDIIMLPHHVSQTHPQMPIEKRASQFMPFAALTGYDEAISETARITEEKKELDENKKEALNEKLQLLQIKIQEHPKDVPTVMITYFKRDEQKEGGEYLTRNGSVKKIDKDNHIIVMLDNQPIPIEDISDISIETDDCQGREL